MRARTRRGMTIVEVLVAALVLGIVAAGALASWSLASQAAANKRTIEIGTAIAVHELERLKAMGYPYLPASPVQSGQPVPTVRWYDKYGQWLGASATTGDFKVKSYVSILIDRDGEANSEDLKEIVVEVWNGDETRLLERARTLLTYGGV